MCCGFLFSLFSPYASWMFHRYVLNKQTPQIQGIVYFQAFGSLWVKGAFLFCHSELMALSAAAVTAEGELNSSVPFIDTIKGSNTLDGASSGSLCKQYTIHSSPNGTPNI